MDNRTKPRRKSRLPAALILAGMAAFSAGLVLLTRTPGSNAENDATLCVLAVGVAMMTAGVTLPFLPPPLVAFVAVMSPILAYVLFVAVVWGGIVLLGTPPR